MTENLGVDDKKQFIFNSVFFSQNRRDAKKFIIYFPLCVFANINKTTTFEEAHSEHFKA